jgi:hypothetical protein
MLHLINHHLYIINAINIMGESSSAIPILSDFSDDELSTLRSSAFDDITLATKRVRDEDSSDDEPRKKPRIYTLTWDQSRAPKPPESPRDKHYHEIWYCKHCDTYNTTNPKRARKYLRIKHRIRVKEDDSDNLKQQKGIINDLFGKQVERQEGRDFKQEKHLVNAINQAAFQEALARLIAIRNLPHLIIKWGEFHAVIFSINYIAKDILIRCRNSIPKLLQDTFLLHQKALQRKLQNALSRIHFSIDMWTAESKKAY